MPYQFKVEEDPKYGLTHKTGTIDFDFGVRGRELEKGLLEAQQKFVRDMELRGLTLYDMPNNPLWIENPDGEKAAFYAIDWEGRRKPKDNLPTERERSLEDSEGMVEYRIVGVFWAPETTYEIVTSRADRIEKEKAEKNPESFFMPSNLVTEDRGEE